MTKAEAISKECDFLFREERKSWSAIVGDYLGLVRSGGFIKYMKFPQKPTADFLMTFKINEL